MADSATVPGREADALIQTQDNHSQFGISPLRGEPVLKRKGQLLAFSL